jgi:hypothetical protein
MAKLTYEQLEAKVNFYEYSIEESRKVVRKALRQHKVWKPEFHENEVTAITAVFLATKELLDQKGKALSVAISFLGKIEDPDYWEQMAVDTLEEINQLIAGESIQDSIKKQVK